MSASSPGSWNAAGPFATQGVQQLLRRGSLGLRGDQRFDDDEAKLGARAGTCSPSQQAAVRVGRPRALARRIQHFGDGPRDG